MKKNECLNSEISYLIAKTGHFDTLTIGDAGLPIPDGVQRIDLAVTRNVPSFECVLETVMSELKTRKAYIAAEMREQNAELYARIIERFSTEHIDVAEIPHEQFKELTKSSKAVIRTGECKPYANIILESDVVF